MLGELHAGLAVAHELVDEERIAAGFAGDRVGVGFASGRILSEQGLGQVPRFLQGQLSDDELPRFGSFDNGLHGTQFSHERAARDILAATTRDEQQRGRIGWPEQIGQQGRAVHVSPLQIVDAQDDVSLLGQARQQLPQRAEGAPPQLLRVRDLEDAALRRRDGLHPPQNRKEPRQGQYVARQDRVHLVGWKPFQVLASTRESSAL